MSTLDEHARSGIAAVNEQRFDDAVSHFEQALAIDRSRPDLNNALGMAYLHRGEAVSAVPYLQRAHELARTYEEPEHIEMRKHFATGLASALAVVDRPLGAVGVLDEMLGILPADVELHLQRASLLVSSLRPSEGAEGYRRVAEIPGVEEELAEAALAISGAIDAFTSEEGLEASVFLKAHAESYTTFFNEQARTLENEGWYFEAARMVRGEDGEARPVIAEGARPWAVERVDMVNPQDGTVAKVGDEKEPIIVAVNGLEPLAQVPVTLPWSGWSFEAWVCSRCPWHWLPVTIELEDALDEAGLKAVDELFGSWYLAGFNGDFGDKEHGRFHYATDLERVGETAVSGTFDLGRASFEAAEDLLKRMEAFHSERRIRRVLLGPGRLPY